MLILLLENLLWKKSQRVIDHIMQRGLKYLVLDKILKILETKIELIRMFTKLYMLHTATNFGINFYL